MPEAFPSLNALRALEAVSRHLSMKGAAAELHVTPAAVSQQIKGLERYLGVTLVSRERGRLRLTERAQRCLPELHQSFQALARAVERLREVQRSNRLTVSVDPSLAARWLVPRLYRFKERVPDVDVLLDATIEQADLSQPYLDLAIRFAERNDPSLFSVLLFPDEVFPVCAPALMAGPQALRTVADLRHHPLLHLEWTPTWGTWPDWSEWLALAAAKAIDVESGPRFTDHGMALQAACAGQGVVLATTALAIDDLDAGRLVEPFNLRIPTRFAYYAVTTQSRARAETVRCFVKWLLEEAGHSRRR